MGITESNIHQMPRQFEVKTIGSSEFAKDYPDVLKAEEVARILRIGKSTVYELAKQNDFPAVNVGRRIIVHKSALLQWLKQKSQHQNI